MGSRELKNKLFVHFNSEFLMQPSPPCPAAGTFMVARIFCRSLSWIGWVGLVAPAEGTGAAGVVGVVTGEAPVAAEGVVGVVGT